MAFFILNNIVMTTVFYIYAIFFIFYELIWVLSPIEKTEDARKFFKLSKEFKNKKWDDFSEEYKSQIKNKIWLFSILLWMFIGLFTFQWAFFLLFIIFNFLIIAPLLNIFKFSTAYTVLHWINSVIGFSFGVFIILNNYHLRIDIIKYFNL